MLISVAQFQVFKYIVRQKGIDNSIKAEYKYTDDTVGQKGIYPFTELK